MSSDRLGPNETLAQGQMLTSKNGAYHLKMQEDGNLVLYISSDLEPKNAKWASGTNGTGSKPYKLTMQADNNLVIYDGFGTAIWASNTFKVGTLGAHLILQDDRNAVVYDGNQKAIWASNTNN